MHSWRVLLLPYLDQQELYSQYDLSEPWNGPRNSRLASRMPEIYALHGEHRPGVAVTNYLAVVGPETIWPGSTTLSSKNVPDGTSSTILVVENLGAGIHWMEPRDLSLAEMSFRLNSPEGISSNYAEPAVVMLDGSLHKLKDSRPADSAGHADPRRRRRNRSGREWLVSSLGRSAPRARNAIRNTGSRRCATAFLNS